MFLYKSLNQRDEEEDVQVRSGCSPCLMRAH